MLKKITLAAVFAALVFATLAVPVAAHAAVPDTRPVPPPGAVQWGMPFSAFERCDFTSSFETTRPTIGGWSTRGPRASNGRAGTAPTVPHPTRPIATWLGEPCVQDVADGARGSRWIIPTYSQALSVSGANSSIGCTASFASCWFSGQVTIASAPTATDSYIRCASSEWSTTQTAWFAPAGTAAASVGNATIPEGSLLRQGHSFFNGNNSSAVTPSLAQCPYVTSIFVTTCVYEEDVPEGGTYPNETRVCHGQTWTAERVFQQKVYTPDDPMVELCRLSPGASALCPSILDGVPPDGTDYDVVCAGAPELTFGDWDALPQWIGHFAHCLFAPANGFDRKGLVSTAWSSSAAGEVAIAASDAVGAYNWSESCGVIGTGTGSTFGTVAIDTCSWSSWAGSIRTILSVGILALGGWYIVQFIWSSALSVVNRRIPTPFELGRTDEKP